MTNSSHGGGRGFIKGRDIWEGLFFAGGGGGAEGEGLEGQVGVGQEEQRRSPL